MTRWVPLSILAIVVLVVCACEPGPHSSSGFRLPEGNAERGKTAFLAYGCQTCHEVAGSNLPKPTVQPPVPVVLGGIVERPMTDGYLTTSIVNPSYQMAGYPREQVAVNGRSRMPHFADRMTVRDLTDIVAFLQSQYIVRRTMPDYNVR